MEYKKDIQINEYQKQVSTTNGQGNNPVLKGQNDIPVHYDEFEKTILNRIEKLTTALYMVTDCIYGDDPLKLKMRIIGVEMLSDMARINRSTQGEKHRILSNFSDKVTELISMLYVSVSVGFISNMNFSVLKREFISLKEDCDNRKDDVFILKTKETLSTDMVGSIADMFKKDFFTDKQKLDTDTIKDTLLLKDTIKKPASNVLYNLKNKTDLSVIKSQKNLSRALDVGLKVERKNKIIKLIKEKKDVTIKDITTTITDCSEKTIQRELSSLVEQGVLNKIGKKRWSRYSLKTL